MQIWYRIPAPGGHTSCVLSVLLALFSFHNSKPQPVPQIFDQIQFSPTGERRARLLRRPFLDLFPPDTLLSTLGQVI